VLLAPAGADAERAPVARTSWLPKITSYRWSFDGHHTLTLALKLNGAARIVVTLYRGAGRHLRHVTTLTFRGRHGRNALTIADWGHRLTARRYTVHVQTRLGRRLSIPRTFSFAH
jgi:hypothetical protein